MPLLLALALLTTGCSLLPGDAEGRRPAVRADVAQRMESVLQRRARALRAGDEQAFWRTVARARPRAVRRAGDLFDNLAQLPLGHLRYTVDAGSVTARGSGWDAVVETALQLEGFDAVPVRRAALYHFVEEPGTGRLVVASDRDGAWERRTGADVQPWDRGPVTVHRGEGVLAVFDRDSPAASADVVAEVQAGIAQVARAVPVEWSRSVVVHATSDPTLLSGLDVPGGDPDVVDAVTFPVHAVPGRPRVASTRFVLHPRMLGSDPTTLGRLVRHELTHVALAERDDRAPVWLAEGLAEWVSVRPIAPALRYLSRDALELARAGAAELPSDEGFNGAHQGAHYGLAWWACEVIARRHGEEMLWELLAEMADAPAEEQPEVLRRLLGVGERGLAEAASRAILDAYG